MLKMFVAEKNADINIVAVYVLWEIVAEETVGYLLSSYQWLETDWFMELNIFYFLSFILVID